MEFLVVGLSHKTASIEIRELLAFSRDTLDHALNELKAEASLSEVMMVSTCNRVEVYATIANKQDASTALRKIAIQLGKLKALPAQKYIPHLYHIKGLKAIRHIFRVAASLDSMIIGEPQILGQVKEAYDIATQAGTIGSLLNRLINHTIRFAKKVRSTTEIAVNPVSVASVAVDLARMIFRTLNASIVYLIGAGEMGTSCARSLHQAGCQRVVIVNRSIERAENLATEYGWAVSPFETLFDTLHEADIIIVSTEAKAYLMEKQGVKKILKNRKYRPQFIIDIAVPRNVHPNVASLEGIYLYDIDDLQSISEENKSKRMGAIQEAEALLDNELNNYIRWLGSLEVAPLIAAMQLRAKEIREQELARTLKSLKHLDKESEDAIRIMTEAICKKMLSDPIITLRKEVQGPDGPMLMTALKKLFNIVQTTSELRKPPENSDESSKNEKKVITDEGSGSRL